MRAHGNSSAHGEAHIKLHKRWISARHRILIAYQLPGVTLACLNGCSGQELLHGLRDRDGYRAAAARPAEDHHRLQGRGCHP